jgi:homoserine O-succinyltransferase
LQKLLISSEAGLERSITIDGQRSQNDTGDEIVIGLINIMPAAAMKTTEALYRRVLNLSSPGRKITLRLFAQENNFTAKPEIAYPGQDYESLDRLWSSHLDAMIVTGTEPQAELLNAEPCWPIFEKLVDWAGENTTSTIWSCFAAHAAVFGISGISRLPYTEKLCGIFECTKSSNHRFVSGLQSRWLVPHSRCNTLSETTLEANGYEILSRAAHLGVDSFIKPHGDSMFMFFQGHPEYSVQILFAEYCRDIKRFLLGQRATYPNMPVGYFDTNTTAAFNLLQEEALHQPSLTLLRQLGEVPMGRLEHSWREPAQQLYAGWLSYIATQKFARTSNSACRLLD